MKGKKGVKAKRPPGVRALDRLVWAAARLETAVDQGVLREFIQREEAN